jgi:superfamily II DNA or RNA helicase
MAQYRQIRDHYRDDINNKVYGSAIERIHALRRLTLCKEKVDCVKGLLDDAVLRGDGYILYCHYVDSAKYWANELGAVCITGEVPSSARLGMAKRGKKVVATIDSLSEGGDLTHLKNVVYVEEDYLAGPATQTLGRVRRPTANLAPVNVYYVMVKHSIDITIHKCVMDRIVNAEAIMEQELL